MSAVVPGSAARAAAAAVRAWARIARAVTRLTTATIAIRMNAARGPKRSMTKVASGGPPTHANETVARACMMRSLVSPECRMSANSMTKPMPAGAPKETRAAVATQSDEVAANEPTSANVSTAAITRGAT